MQLPWSCSEPPCPQGYPRRQSCPCRTLSEPRHSTEANALKIICLRALTDITDRSGHAFRKSAAGAFGPDLAKKLSQLVKMEKNVMRSMELVGRERMEVAVSLAAKVLVI
jgi:hypothetical protein